MENHELKQQLIRVCRQKILDSIANLEAAMNDAQQQANDYGAPRDRYDAFRTQLTRRRDMLAQQLSKELSELQVLEKLEAIKQPTLAGFGALVLTDDQNYFISIGLGKIELPEKVVYAISPVVPISQALQGKKKGENFEFRGKASKILDVV